MEETDFKGIDLLETGEWQGKSIACLGEEELKCALSYVKRPTTIFRRLFMRKENG